MALLEKSIAVKTSTIPNSGQGLFTNVLIPKGTRIVEYKGRVSTWKEVRHDNGENAYIYFMNRNHVIDASRAKTSFARYSNDARGLTRIAGLANNAEYIEEGKRVFIVAKRDIQAGEEIFVGYGAEYWQTIRHNIRVEKQQQKEAAAKAALKEKRELAKKKQVTRKLELREAKKAKTAGRAAAKKKGVTSAGKRKSSPKK